MFLKTYALSVFVQLPTEISRFAIKFGFAFGAYFEQWEANGLERPDDARSACQLFVTLIMNGACLALLPSNARLRSLDIAYPRFTLIRIGAFATVV